MAINSVNSNQSAITQAAAGIQPNKKPGKPFPSMAELMAAGQNQPTQPNDPTSSINSTDSAVQTRRA
jgi:hypothetical protein